MSPDELRAAADEMDEWVNPNNAFDICMDAARRLADVIEWAASVPQVEKYPTFAAGWEEAALRVLDLARGETEGTEAR